MTRPAFVIALATAAPLMLTACGDANSNPGAEPASDGGAPDTPVVDAAGASDGSGGETAPDTAADTGGDAAPTAWSVDPPAEAGGDRLARVVRPADYDPEAREYPLVLLLHGYGVNGVTQDAFLGVSALVDVLDFVLVLPDGTKNSEGLRFWAATPACCNFDGAPVDDVAYLTGLVDEVMQTHRIDAGRVYSFGHSNGGFMSFRLACAASERFVAIASLAGATFTDPAECAPAVAPVSVLQIHGTADDTILYEGAEEFWASPDGYPSASQTVLTHAELLGCDVASVEEIEPRDLDNTRPGIDTTGVAYRTGCAAGTDAQLWTIDGGVHIPPINPRGTEAALRWLLAHDRTP